LPGGWRLCPRKPKELDIDCLEHLHSSAVRKKKGFDCLVTPYVSYAEYVVVLPVENRAGRRDVERCRHK
jgi:hypothetical protein